MAGNEGVETAEPKGVTPEYVHGRLVAGEPLLLVCAYQKDVGFQKYRIRDALPWSDVWARLPRVPKEHEIVFY